MSAISGAFSGRSKLVRLVDVRNLWLGLIAFGVFHIKHSKYKEWQFLFWVEGTFYSTHISLSMIPVGRYHHPRCLYYLVCLDCVHLASPFPGDMVVSEPTWKGDSEDQNSLRFICYGWREVESSRQFQSPWKSNVLVLQSYLTSHNSRFVSDRCSGFGRE